MSERIRGGYILKARCIEKSAIAHAPPHVRDIWDYLLRKAFWQDGQHLKCGELSTSYREIQEALHWKIGWRKEQFSKSQCENAMKYLKKAEMITARRTTGGFIISVCNYCRFQDPKNYESHGERYRKATGEPQPPDTTDEEGYKKEPKEEGEGSALHGFYLEFRQVHRECERVTEQDFIAAVARSRTTDSNGKVSMPDVAGALADFRLNCACLSSFKPQSPVQKFRNYLQYAGDKESSGRFQKKNAAQEAADKAALHARLMERPAGEETQAERLKKKQAERLRKQHEAKNQKSED